MVSLDVVSLFMGIPTDETLTVVQEKLVADPSLKEHACVPRDNLMEMLTFCVEMNYFRMESDVY